MRVIALFVVLPALAIGQTKSTGSAETKGNCSPANTGNNNTFNITCQGISEKVGAQLIGLLNRVAKNQLDAEAVMAKLDGCLRQLAWRILNTADTDRVINVATVFTRQQFTMRSFNEQEEPSQLREALHNILVSAGWLFVPTNHVMIGVSLVGVSIEVPPSHASAFEPAASALASILNQVGVKAVERLNPGEEDHPDMITIRIGTKPQE